ncbi:hypothetical protein NITLEN_60191 [Nitrospira lenta]|uniref:Uncharacterized protein n=1 Tax=Nitrospira lenta TaxID=1436998 RepID=A0A330LAV1_9BACT|nr:hypothetical protein NITLEN_60191 [Nitrospira lenta]
MLAQYNCHVMFHLGQKDLTSLQVELFFRVWKGSGEIVCRLSPNLVVTIILTICIKRRKKNRFLVPLTSVMLCVVAYL